MKITLYQIIPELDNDHLMFRDLQFIRTASNNQVPAELYESVYSGELEIQGLEDAYYIFNMAHPEGYQGRSMSVSDVVELATSDGDSEFFFCDSIGFKKIPFDKKRAMLPIINRDFKQEDKIQCGQFHIVFCGEFGVDTIWCSKIVLTRCQYSQCQLGYKLMYWLHGQDRWCETTFLSRPKILLAHTGFRGIPESVFFEYPDKNIRKRKFAAFSDENFCAVEQWCREQNVAYEYL